MIFFLISMWASGALASTTLGRQDTANAGAQSSQPAETAPVPIPEIVARSQEVSAALRAMEAGLDSDTSIALAGERLPALAREIDARAGETSRILGAQPSLETLRKIEADWLALNASLPAWKRDLQARATRLETDLERLASFVATWEQTLESAKSSGVPQEILDRVEATIALIRRTRERVERRRAHVLTLQSRVFEQEARINETIALIRQTREAAVSRLFFRDSPPLWSASLWTRSMDDLLSEGRESIAAQRMALGEYAGRQTERFILHAVLFLLLVALLYSARRRKETLMQDRTWAEKEPDLKPAMIIFKLPVATALLLSILASTWIYPQAPRALGALLGAVALVPAIIVLRHLVERKMLPLTSALAVFYFIDRLRELAASGLLTSRLLLLAEALGAILFLAWLIKRTRPEETSDAAPNRKWKIITLAARTGLVIFAFVSIANALGYVGLARIIGNAAMGSAYIAVTLYAVLQILYSLVTLALRVRPLVMLGMVRAHEALLFRRAQIALRWVAAFIWVLLTLDLLALREPLFARARSVLGAEFALRAIHVSLGDVVIFILTVWFSFLLSRFLRFALEEEVYARVELARGIPYAVSTMLHYVVLLIGFFLAMAAIGVNLDRFAILAGALGVGIGFGLQNIVNNFVSGLILLFERPVKVGDTVQLGERGGELKRIGLRASIMRTWEGSEVIVPNGGLISEEVINWTLSDQQRRMEMSVGVAYGTDPERVIELLTEVASSHPDVMEDPAPQALFVGFGDSSLDFILRAWTDHFDRWMTIRSELMVGINTALREARISIPFPQRDLHFQSIAPEAGKALLGTMSDSQK